MTVFVFLTAVEWHGLQSGLFLVYCHLLHQCGQIFQSRVFWVMPVQRLWFILGEEWGFSDMEHAGSLKVLQGPWLDCRRIRRRIKKSIIVRSYYCVVLGMRWGRQVYIFTSACSHKFVTIQNSNLNTLKTLVTEPRAVGKGTRWLLFFRAVKPLMLRNYTSPLCKH